MLRKTPCLVQCSVVGLLKFLIMFFKVDEYINFLKLISDWSIDDLQCCVSFCSIAK